ncbi:MAG: hypothetical protein L6R39_006275 [Caloplaca ligustica]|nr:MAG: hypothetical protein L6R39_006275 [Caloplaca ligustica]
MAAQTRLALRSFHRGDVGLGNPIPSPTNTNTRKRTRDPSTDHDDRKSPKKFHEDSKSTFSSRILKVYRRKPAISNIEAPALDEVVTPIAAKPAQPAQPTLIVQPSSSNPTIANSISGSTAHDPSIQERTPVATREANKRSLRSQNGGSRFKSELASYFADYDDILTDESKTQEFLTPATRIHIVDEPSKPSPSFTRHASGVPPGLDPHTPPPPTHDPSLQAEKRANGISQEEDLKLNGAERLDFSVTERHARNIAKDPLTDDLYFKAHRRAERGEKSHKNREKESAQHEKFHLERILDDLNGQSWLKAMGITGITDTEKKVYEPKRVIFIQRVTALLDKFKAWKEEEKRRKFERDRAFTTDEEEEEDDEELNSDRSESPGEYDGVFEPDGNSMVRRRRHRETTSGRTETSAAAKSVRRQNLKLLPVAPEKPFTSFYSKPYLRDAALNSTLDNVHYIGMASVAEPQSAQPSNLGFSVSHQKVELDIDLLARWLKGRAEITINPHFKELKSVRLNCRQCNIRKVTANGRPCPNFVYEEPYSKASLGWEAGVHQHHMLRKKIEAQLKSPPEEELVVNLPKSVRIDDLDPFSIEATAVAGARSSVGLRDDGFGELQSARTAVEPERRYTPVTLIIDFAINYIRDGMHFVGWEEEDLRYPHAYTKSFSAPGGACCLFPCVDDLSARCTWEISIKCPKTVGDAFRPSRPTSANGGGGLADGVNSDYPFQSNMSAEDQALELAVICTGDMTDEVDDHLFLGKKTSTFFCGNPLSAQQVGFGIGPFEHVDLAEFREGVEDDKLGQNAVPLHGFCLPGRVEEVRNTCVLMAKAIDFFTLEYGSYPFSDYKLCFVDDVFPETIHTGFLTICNNSLLFPADVLEPLERVSRQMVHALASQWMGVSVIPKEPTDTWVVVGIAYFMTDAFLRKLFGKNDYGFRQKQAADRVVDLDMGRPSIHDTGAFVDLDRLEMEFLELKAPLVLSILDRRFTKTGSASGLSRIVSRVFLNAKVGDLANGAISTSYFAKTCERLGHTKLDTFFAQWVYGAGCPRFSVTQKFNKKKNVIEMLIQQRQAEPPARDLQNETFMRDVKEELNSVYAGPVQPVFTGPMTICIHEADGSPYEHLIEIKDAITKFEILYNTKYKRLKRSKRQKERIATAGGVEYNPDGNEDVLLYCLGDVLQTEEEMEQWRLAEWPRETEDEMNQEAYEWIRVDSNFEWICRTSVNMPGYMYLSQLQQDKDVVAQLESLQFMAAQKEHALISTILMRTLMDTRYFHGIRTAAAAALAKHAREGDMDWRGLFHLEKAFQHFFCYNDSPIPRPNDFSDRAAYFIKCAISKAIGKVRDARGRSPIRARMFLLDKLKFNDNSINEFSDSHYIATLMEALSEAMASKPPPGQDMDGDFDFDENDGDDLRFHESCLEELDRYRRTDEWLPSYHNILSRTALDCTRILSLANVIDSNPSHLIQYTRDGTADELRICAFSNLFEMGLSANDAVMRWFLFAMGTDPSPYFRSEAFRLSGHILASIAVGSGTDDAATVHDGLIIEQEASTESRRADLARRRTVVGALAALKDEVKDNQTLKQGIWTAITSRVLTFAEIKDLLDLCQLLYDPESSMVVKLRYPRYWRCKKVGKGKLAFSHTDRIRTRPIPTKRGPPPLMTMPPPAQQQQPGMPFSPSIKREDSSISDSMPPPPSQQPRKPLFKPPRRPSEGVIDTGGSAKPSPVAERAPATTPTTTTAEGEKPKLKIKLKLGPRLGERK